MDRLSEMELFVCVADSGSLTKAADTLGISTSSASRYLTALEGRLNARLVQRTILLDEKRVGCGSARDAIRSGIAYVPEDRARRGVFLDAPVATNITASILGKVSRMTIIEFINRTPATREFKRDRTMSTPTPFSFAGVPIYVLTSSRSPTSPPPRASRSLPRAPRRSRAATRC